MSDLPTIAIVPDETSDLTQQIDDLHDPEGGICVVKTRPNMRRLGWLATDIMQALGKTTGSGFAADGWPVAASHLLPWLTVSRIEHLIIGSAELLNTNWLTELAQFAQLAETSLWLIADAEFGDALACLIEDFGADVVQPAELPHRLRTTPREQAPQARQPAPFPTKVPDDSALTFLATARQSLSEDIYRPVFRAYVTAYDQSVAWLETLTEPPSEADTARQLRDLVQHQHRLPEVTTAARALQAAALRKGLLVKVDPRRFLNRMVETRTALDLSHQDWQLLASNGSTRQCAIAVLSALGISIEEMLALPAESVATDGSTVSTGTGHHDVPEPARHLLTVQMLYRAAAADPINPQFLAGSRKDAHLCTRGVSLLIDKLTVSTGIAFRARYDQWDSTSIRWHQRSGISVRNLASC